MSYEEIGNLLYQQKAMAEQGKRERLPGFNEGKTEKPRLKETGGAKRVDATAGKHAARRDFVHDARTFTYPDGHKQQLGYRTDSGKNYHRLNPGESLYIDTDDAGLTTVKINKDFPLALSLAQRLKSEQKPDAQRGQSSNGIKIKASELAEVKEMVRVSNIAFRHAFHRLSPEDEQNWFASLQELEGAIEDFEPAEGEEGAVSLVVDPSKFFQSLNYVSTGIPMEYGQHFGLQGDIELARYGADGSEMPLKNKQQRLEIARDEQGSLVAAREKLRPEDTPDQSMQQKKEKKTGNIITEDPGYIKYLDEIVPHEILESNSDNVIAASIRGASHEKEHKLRQDALLVSQINDQPFVAVSDGHGSEKCFRSHRGAKFAVESAKKHLEDLANVLETENITKVGEYAKMVTARNIVADWRERVRKDISQQPFTSAELKKLGEKAGQPGLNAVEKNPFTAYGATFLCSARIGDFAVFLKLGDGDILITDEEGKVNEVMEKDDRLLANETTSLCLPAAQHEMQVVLRRLSSDKHYNVMISTDGYSNSYADDKAFHEAASDLSNKTPEDIKNNIVKWLKETSIKGSGDDITLAWMRL